MASVLVVEDNADLREMYTEILAIAGHSTQSVETAAEALAAITAARPDVALVDLGIVGGTEGVIGALREDPAVAVILASGARDLAEQAQALRADHLQKPFGPDELIAAVERALGR